MGYQINENVNSHVEIHTTGTMDFVQTKSMVETVAEKAIETGLSKYLFNFSNTDVDINPFEIRELFNIVTGFKIEQPLIIAFVYILDMHDHRHAENVGINRGYVIRGFQSLKDATTWLLGSKKAPIK